MKDQNHVAIKQEPGNLYTKKLGKWFWCCPTEECNYTPFWPSSCSLWLSSLRHYIWLSNPECCWSTQHIASALLRSCEHPLHVWADWCFDTTCVLVPHSVLAEMPISSSCIHGSCGWKALGAQDSLHLPDILACKGVIYDSKRSRTKACFYRWVDVIWLSWCSAVRSSRDTWSGGVSKL